jgi:response regulator RpfG family c-di-GMP phosphodiesterase
MDPTHNPKTPAGSFHNPLDYLHLIFQEIKNIWTYLIALIVGLLIFFFSENLSWVNFMVPFFVQVIAKSIVRFKSRDLNLLVELPAQRDDPSFIMDHEGRIVLSAGKTKALFESLDIKYIQQFIGKKGFDAIRINIDPTCLEAITVPVEIYSSKTRKWYEAKAKPMFLYCGKPMGKYLVWFQDISFRKEYDLQQKELLQYTGALVSRLRELVKKDNALENIATFILNNYQAVFIIKKDEEKQFIGFVFKLKNNKIERSAPIILPESSLAPVFQSRVQSRIVTDDITRYASEGIFQSKYHFDRQVLKFIDSPVQNFINYHQGDISIIVFNSHKKVTIYEKQFMEVLLNLSQSIITLVDLARENDAQFLQKVMGLCAAAEYSDQITGKHILRVNEYSRFIAEKMGFNDEFVETIGQIAALHDIGKVAIPDIIKLPRKYNQAERLKMQMHTVYGADIIETMMGYETKKDFRLRMARNIALHHHQTYNGKGYPLLKNNGNILVPLSKNYKDYLVNEPLSGDEIPIEGLIVGLADRYDALRSRRQYKLSLSHEEVLKILAFDESYGIAGEKWYGPEIWKVFIENEKEFKNIYDGFQE